MSALLYEIEDEVATSLEFLVEAAQAGDRDAFGELATRFEPMVYSIALRRLGNHSEAQELCQEVLVKAMQKIEQLKVPAFNAMTNGAALGDSVIASAGLESVAHSGEIDGEAEE